MSDQLETGDSHGTDEVDRDDIRWYYAILLAGITLAVTAVNAVIDPSVTTVAVAVGMLAVFTLLVYAIAPTTGERICRLFGHAWNLEEPWSGKELGAVKCERCGEGPEEIRVTGKHDGDHRV